MKTVTSNTILGNGIRWKLQYGFNKKLSGDISGWSINETLPTSIFQSHSVVTKNRVYLLGGWINDSPSREIYSALINEDGSIGAWSKSEDSLPVEVIGGQIISSNSRVYLLGGWINGLDISSVYTAPINPDGTLGIWTTDTELPVTIRDSSAVIIGNKIHLLGGSINRKDSAETYNAVINEDGSLSQWVKGNDLPTELALSQVVVIKDRVYLLGGWSSYPVSSVYSAPINADGSLGKWIREEDLPNTVAQSQALVTDSTVYLLGGIVNSTISDTVHTAPINPDGSLGKWVEGTCLPASVRLSQAVITSSKIYLLGGEVDIVPGNVIFSATIE